MSAPPRPFGKIGAITENMRDDFPIKAEYHSESAAAFYQVQLRVGFAVHYRVNDLSCYLEADLPELAHSPLAHQSHSLFPTIQ